MFRNNNKPIITFRKYEKQLIPKSMTRLIEGNALIYADVKRLNF